MCIPLLNASSQGLVQYDPILVTICNKLHTIGARIIESNCVCFQYSNRTLVEHMSFEILDTLSTSAIGLSWDMSSHANFTINFGVGALAIHNSFIGSYD